MIEIMVINGVLPKEYQGMLIVDTALEHIIEAFAADVPPLREWNAAIPPTTPDVQS